MALTIQVRNVPDELHRKLKSRAALAGMSLSAYVLSELRSSLDRPKTDELMQRLRARDHVSVHPSSADSIRQEREHR